MATTTAGNPVTLDALFNQEGQGSPDAVTFTVEQPDQVTATFVSGDPTVTNPTGDYWECALGVPTEVGEYRWKAVGTMGSGLEVTETIYGTVFVQPSVVDPAAPTPAAPALGPCSMWISGDDVAACARVDYGSNPAVFDTAAFEASMALYEISGRRFPGLCEREVRPCRNQCSCWLTGPLSYGMGPWFWTTVPWGFGGWAWYNENGDRYGCSPMSKVNLAGYPVREILEVKIDGVVLPEFNADTGARQWRLDKWRYLIRMDTPAAGGVPATPNLWPGCQNMSLDSDQPGTFAVTYKWGSDVPALGRDAAVELANQLFLACGGRECVLPPGAARVERQGIVVERGLLANWADPKKATGLVQLDTFLQAYAGGARSARRGAVWSPDRQPFARRVGTPPVGS